MQVGSWSHIDRNYVRQSCSCMMMNLGYLAWSRQNICTLSAEMWRFAYYSETSIMSDLIQIIRKPAKLGEN